MSNFGDKAATLVQDISQSEKGTIPPYNDELVRAVVDESNEHHRSILRLIGDIQEQGTSSDAAAPEDAAAILVHHQAVPWKQARAAGVPQRARGQGRALRWRWAPRCRRIQREPVAQRARLLPSSTALW